MTLSKRRIDTSLVVDGAHYDELCVKIVMNAKTSVFIATANLKDLHVEAPIGTRARARGQFMSMFEHLVSLARQGVEIRILHGGLPSGPMRQRLAAKNTLRDPRRGETERGVLLRRCPRVHLKMVAVDGTHLYLGSANFTGAGLGAKGEGRRNFEMGVLTDDDVTLDRALSRFDDIWRGKECASCKLRRECPKPLDLVEKPPTRYAELSSPKRRLNRRVSG